MQSSDLIKSIHERFVSRHMTLSIAESCTGGALISTIVSQAGASVFVKGAVVAYSNDVKCKELEVKKTTLQAAGAVSQEVALQMAKGVRKRLESTWSLGITGIAGPSGGSKDKPVGTVCIAVCGPSFEFVEKNLFAGSRSEIIAATVKRSMELILKKTT